MITEEEIKLRLFESIATNSEKLCDSGRYMPPLSVARHVNEVYNYLFKQSKEE